MSASHSLLSFSEAIKQYKVLRPKYEQLTECLQASLRDICRNLGIYPIMMGRAKSLESFADKISRADKDYLDPLNELTDLCGVRIIVHTMDQVDRLSEVIASQFVIDKMNSLDKQVLLNLREFGYLSRHLIVQLKETPVIEELTMTECECLTGLKAELQVRTVLQHAWADIYHELGYKNEFKLPPRWEREFAQLAALLENCDQGFQDIQNAMGTYESNYGAYLSQQDLLALSERLELILKQDPKNSSVMHRLIRVYDSLDDKADKIEAILASNKDVITAYTPALRDIGVVLCRKYSPTSDTFQEGLIYLQQAVEKNAHDVDALCSLGGAYRRKQDRTAAIDCYRRAHQLDPTNPYPLGNYIAEEMLRTGHTELVDYFRATIDNAFDRCRKQTEVNVNIPWSYFDLGTFSLYLGRTGDSIAFFAKGIELSPKAWMVESARKPIMRFIEASVPLEGLILIDKLLETGERLKAHSDRQKEVSTSNGSVSFQDSKVLVLAGGCSHMSDDSMGSLSALHDSLLPFQGTIVSGGTKVGVPALAGELQVADHRGGLKTVGYLPAQNTPDIAQWIDARYTVHRYTEADDFSPLVALTFWEDFLVSGAQPTTLKLIGFNGGEISAAEFRIALAFGARVGIIQDSGRAADAILEDPLWKDHPGLHTLELSNEAISAFIDND